MLSLKTHRTAPSKPNPSSSPELRHAKTRKEIAAEYGIDARTLNKWLQRRQVALPSGNLCPSSQQLIYDTLGWPGAKLE